MRTLPYAALVASLLALAVLFAGLPGSAALAPPLNAHPRTAAWPGPAPSIAFGTPESPQGGTLVVGLLVATPQAKRLVELLTPEAYAKFLEREVALQKSDGAGQGFEAPELLAETGVDDDALEARAARRRALAGAAEEVRELTGLNVVFQHLLAPDCAQVPLVLVRGRIRHDHDLRILAAAQARGTRILLTGAVREGVGETVADLLPEAGSPVATGPDAQGPDAKGPDAKGRAQPLVRACLETIARSTRLGWLAADPLALVSARRQGDEVCVRVREACSAEVRDAGSARGLALASEADGTFRFASPDPGIDPRSRRLVLAWSQGDLRLTRAWSVADLVGAADPTVVTPRRLEAGASYSPHVVFLNSLTGDPVPGYAASLALWRSPGAAAGLLAEAGGITDACGSLGAALLVPDGAPLGPALLRVGGHDFAVEIVSGLRLSLVTERSLYRPDDSVCVRAMLHRAGNGHPVAGQEIVLRLGETETRVTTSEHGIASARLPLHAARLGPGQVEGVAGSARSVATFRVRAFEVPSFTVEMEPVALALEPGQGAPVRIHARYINGEPVVGAAVTVAAPAGWEIPGTTAITDAAGRCELEVRAPTWRANGAYVLTVQDADGRRQEQQLAVAVEPLRAGPAEPQIEVAALDEPIVGRPCRLEIRCATAASVALGLGDAPTQPVPLDATHRGVVSVTPDASSTSLRLRVGEVSLQRTLAASVREPSDVVLVPSRRLWTVGETFVAEVLGPDGPAYVDLMRDGTVLATRGVLLAQGQGTVSLPLRPEGAGLLEARVWRPSGDQGLDVLRGSRVRLLVVRGKPLEVTGVPDAERYRPGQTAAVDVTVRDGEGRPTAAVLGYWGVDEALLALAPAREGLEEVFDIVGPRSDAALAPLAVSYAQGRSASDAEARALLRPLEAGVTFADENGWRQHTGSEREATRRGADLDAAAQALAGLRAEFLEQHRRLPLERLQTAASLPERLRWLLVIGRLEGTRLLDPWGSSFAFEPRVSRIDPSVPLPPSPGWQGRPRRDWETSEFGTACTSAGPDLCWGTTDDILLVWSTPSLSEVGGTLARFLTYVVEQRMAEASVREEAELVQSVEVDADVVCEECFGATEGLSEAPFEGPQSNNLLGVAGGAGGAYRVRSLMAGGSGGRGDAPPLAVHVRRDFEPTLCFVPEAIVGPEGRTRLEIPLKDSITTWRLRLVASAADGVTGTGGTRLHVGQPLHVEPWVATHLTVGDEIELPVAVRNETDQGQQVDLQLRLSPELEVVGAREASVDVGAHGTGAHVFRLRARAPGRARVRVDAGSGALADAVERVVSVRPLARAERTTAVGTLTPDQPWDLVLAPAAPGRPSERSVELYASPLADVVGGFEGLIACPHG